MTTTRAVIIATAAICKMNSDDRETLLLDILASNPATVVKVMQSNGVNFGDSAVNMVGKFKIVIDKTGPDKIRLIKFCREQVGAGLADAKAWSEGGEFFIGDVKYSNGGLHYGLSYKDAVAKAKELNDKMKNGYTDNIGYKCIPSDIRVMVVKEDSDYRFGGITTWR